MSPSSRHPHFEDPPVVEVALSVALQPIARLGLVSLVDAWREKFRIRYPNVEEQAPFEMPMENVGEPPRGPSIRLGLVNAPFPIRLWLVNDDGTQLLQLQQGLFARNWRRRPGGIDYPRYPALVDSFEHEYRHYSDFVRRHKLGDLRPTQVELTYINHIVVDDDPGSAIPRILSFVRGPALTKKGKPEQLRVAAQYLIQDGGKPIGRLHVSAEPAVRVEDSQPIVVLTITSRGAPLADQGDGIRAFLDIGREWAFDAFTRLTSPEMHKRWRRTDGA